MNLFNELRGVLTALDGAQVDYALIGGLAVADGNLMTLDFMLVDGRAKPAGD